MLNPVTAKSAFSSGLASVGDHCILFDLKPCHVVLGENRISYTTQTQMVEVAREYFWENEVSRTTSMPIDSICKEIRAEFLKPLIVPCQACVSWKIADVGLSSYDTLFVVGESPPKYGEVCATFFVKSVFFDDKSRRAVRAPWETREFLKSLQN